MNPAVSIAVCLAGAASVVLVYAVGRLMVVFEDIAREFKRLSDFIQSDKDGDE